MVEENDKITHNISLDDQFDDQKECNLFQSDLKYEQTEAEWDEIKKEILGEEASRLNQEGGVVANQDDSNSEPDLEDIKDLNSKAIFDFTEKDLVNLRRTIYLSIRGKKWSCVP